MQYPKVRLKPEYFASSRPWWFNSPDMLYFAYLLIGLLFGLILLISILSFSMGSNSNSESPPKASVNENKTPVETALEKNQASPGADNAIISDFKTEFEAAQSQNTYDLRVQAFDRLLLQEQFTSAEKEQFTTARQQNLESVNRAKKQVQQIESLLNQEYFSDAIIRSQKLLKEGELLGAYREEALKLLEKAHLKKIDYFLIQKANLSKASAALKEAEADQISPEKLAHYQGQIKSLRSAGN